MQIHIYKQSQENNSNIIISASLTDPFAVHIDKEKDVVEAG